MNHFDTRIDLKKLTAAVNDRLIVTLPTNLSKEIGISPYSVICYRDDLVTKILPKTANKLIAFFGEAILK